MSDGDFNLFFNQAVISSMMNRNNCEELGVFLGKERPITADEACDVRILLFGNTQQSFGNEWIDQSFYFKKRPTYGLSQKRAGPCGVLAGVQSYVLLELLFGEEASTRNTANDGLLLLRPNEREKQFALARALAQILWQAGQYKQSIVAVKSQTVSLGSSVTSTVLEGDGFLEYVRLKYFDCQGCLLMYFLNFVPAMMEDNSRSVVLFLYSLILSRGIEKIKEDMDFPESHLIGEDGYCSQEIINLILVGKAVSNLHDGVVKLNSGGENVTIHRGIPNKSKIGLLSLYEFQNNCLVGKNYKYPKSPIWVVLGESHFTVLFGTDIQILNEINDSPFTLYHFDGLAKYKPETCLRIDITSDSSVSPADNYRPVVERCIKTRWPNASIQSIQIPSEEKISYMN